MRRNLLLAVAGWLAIACRPSGTPVSAPPSGKSEETRAPSSGARVIQDCPDCPRMIRIPGGSFTMGSPPDEIGRHAIEGPQPDVAIPAFALGATEVTRGQFEAFVRATGRPMPGGCFTHGDGADTSSDWDVGASWLAPAFAQASDHPVVCVTWQDAVDYAAWMSGKTGQRYRLPSEAEWEYAARGGTTTPFFWGTSADRSCTAVNGGDQSLARALPRWQAAIGEDLRSGNAIARLMECDDGNSFTSPVGQYRANPFGLHDIAGNVWEWTADCRSPRLPTDSRPIEEPPCTSRRNRGGSWDDYPDDLRSGRRAAIPPDTRRNDTGFRLARELSPGRSAGGGS